MNRLVKRDVHTLSRVQVVLKFIHVGVDKSRQRKSEFL